VWRGGLLVPLMGESATWKRGGPSFYECSSSEEKGNQGENQPVGEAWTSGAEWD